MYSKCRGSSCAVGRRQPDCEKWEVGGGKWEVGNGKWEVGSGKWEVGNGKWEMGSGKWEMGNGKWEMGSGKREMRSESLITYIPSFTSTDSPAYSALQAMRFLRCV